VDVRLCIMRALLTTPVKRKYNFLHVGLIAKLSYFLSACVAALLDAGANPSLANLGGHKPIDYANSDVMRKFLESYIIKVTYSIK